MQASFVQLRGPVQNDGHGRGLCLPDLRVDQKSLPVSAHVINEEVINWDWLPGSSLEKCDWRARIKVGPGRYRRGHHLSVRG